MSVVSMIGFLSGKQRVEFGYSRMHQVRGVEAHVGGTGGLRGLRHYNRGERFIGRAHSHGHAPTAAVKRARHNSAARVMRMIARQNARKARRAAAQLAS